AAEGGGGGDSVAAVVGVGDQEAKHDQYICDGSGPPRKFLDRYICGRVVIRGRGGALVMGGGGGHSLGCAAHAPTRSRAQRDRAHSQNRNYETSKREKLRAPLNSAGSSSSSTKGHGHLASMVVHRGARPPTPSRFHARQLDGAE